MRFHCTTPAMLQCDLWDFEINSILFPLHVLLRSTFPPFICLLACELNRLFRTEFFNIASRSDSSNQCQYEFTFREQQVSDSHHKSHRSSVLTESRPLSYTIFQILHGQKSLENSTKHYRQQHSPLIAEILTVSPYDEEILKIGREKYDGWVEHVTLSCADFNWIAMQIWQVSVQFGAQFHNPRVSLAFNWTESRNPWSSEGLVRYDVVFERGCCAQNELLWGLWSI